MPCKTEKTKQTPGQSVFLIAPCSQRHYKDKSNQVFGSKKSMKIKDQKDINTYQQKEEKKYWFSVSE